MITGGRVVAETVIGISCIIIQVLRFCLSPVFGHQVIKKDQRLGIFFLFVILNRFLVFHGNIVAGTEFFKPALRSEERRVGKESRSRWWRYQESKSGYSS